MKLKNIKKMKYVAGLFVLVTSLIACSKMDATYVDFIKKGSITYVGTPDSLKVYPGKNRLKLEWMISDPTATRAQIYWNNKSDSLIVPVVVDPVTKKMTVWLNDLREGSYSFQITFYDKDNNRSVVSNTIGRVYGDNYVNTLLTRPVKSGIFRNDSLVVTWGAADLTVVATELKYNDKNGQPHTAVTLPSEIVTKFPNYSMAAYGTFQYRSLYVPDSLAIDTFYTPYQTVKVTGPPIDYVRTAWTASETDYDLTNPRMPKNVLDGVQSTIWHMDKTKGYPQQMTVDMKTENLVNGFFYNQRTALDGPVKLVELLSSNDGTTWKSLGAYTFENIGTKQYLELLEPSTFRYFRLIVRSDYKNGTATALAELGTYRR
ncbi:MAG: hypothetical protein EOO88_08490 [Pedobacter sp.]|nr:MAG: hypothetical protein EOO88_08490 [Pedobacter sp.]